MAALCVGVVGAQTIVGVAGERGRRRGGRESLAGDVAYPVGCAGLAGAAGGRIMISCVLSHQTKERQEGGPRVDKSI